MSDIAWFKVDDGFYSHLKTLSIPRAGGLRAIAAGTWTLCGTWSADKKLDGFVPLHMIDELGGTVEGADALVAAKMWKKRRDGYQFVNWAEFQPTRAEQEDVSEKERLRKAKYREALAASKQAGQSADVPLGQIRNPDVSNHPDPTRPDPTRPDPTLNSSTKSSGAAKRGTRIPKDFGVTPEMVAWAKEKAPLVNGKIATEKFINHFTAATGQKATKLNWVLTWRNWMLTDQERQEAIPGNFPTVEKKRFVAHEDEMAAYREAVNG